MIGWLLRRIEDKRRLDNFAAPADQVEEFESADEVREFYENEGWKLQEAHQEQVRQLYTRYHQARARWTNERQKALDVFLESAITERDAEKALEVFEAIE